MGDQYSLLSTTRVNAREITFGPDAIKSIVWHGVSMVSECSVWNDALDRDQS
jgi:hypothetical protein